MIDMSEAPTPETLRKLLRYVPDTGKLYWLPRPLHMFKSEPHGKSWNTRYANKEAFTANKSGYKTGRIFDTSYQSHRVIWAIVHGEWPNEQIDHINGVRDDNRIVNLRSVNNLENSMNQRIRAVNTTGILGVSWSKQSGKWHSRIMVRGQNIHLGYYSEIEDAMNARRKADKIYGFHDNHGDT